VAYVQAQPSRNLGQMAARSKTRYNDDKATIEAGWSNSSRRAWSPRHSLFPHMSPALSHRPASFEFRRSADSRPGVKNLRLREIVLQSTVGIAVFTKLTTAGIRNIPPWHWR